MFGVLASCWALLVLTALPSHTQGFFRFQAHHQPAGFDFVHNVNPQPDLGQFWNLFHSRIAHMEQAAHQNAANLEGLLRRWVPEPLPSPPALPATPLDGAEDFGHEEEEVHDHSEDPFSPTHFFADDDAEEDDFTGLGGHGFFHALGIRPNRPGRPARPGIASNFPRVWWQGPNVCITREEIEDADKEKEPEKKGRQLGSFSAATTFIVDGLGESNYHFSSCEQSPSKYVCTTVTKEGGKKKKDIVTHQCCHGYRRSDNNICTKMDLKDVVGTARDMGAAMFAQSMEASGMDMDAMKKRNITLFAPSDTAMQGFNNALLEQNEVEVYVHSRRRRDTLEPVEDNNLVMPANNLQELVLSHIVPGLIDLREAVNEQVLYSENAQNSSIRLNVYRTPELGAPVVTANCVQVRAEAPAENGAVAVVENVLSPVTRNIADLIDDNPQLSTFKKVLEKADMWEKLKQEGQWTVFAATDDAFQRLPPALLVRLLEGNACVDNVARHHVVQSTLCSACVTSRVTAHTLAGESLLLSRVPGEVEGSEELRVENTTFSKTDIMATNGVLHLVDQVLMPQSARTLSQALADRGLESLVRALGAQGLLDEMDNMRNITFFAPSQEALKTVSEEDLPRDTLLYHVAKQEVASCDLENNMQLKSMLEGHLLRVNLFKTMPTFNVGPSRATVQCARVTSVDEAACGATVHELDRVISLPAGDIIDTIEKREEFSTLLEMIKGTKYEEKLKGEEATLTVLAPTNEAFEQVPADLLEKMRGDVTMREHILSKHILTEILCCDGIAAPSWPFNNHVTTEFGTHLPLRRGPAGELHVGPLELKKCDIVATNGVVHSVQAVRVTPGIKRRNSGFVAKATHNPNVQVELYGL